MNAETQPVINHSPKALKRATRLAVCTLLLLLGGAGVRSYLNAAHAQSVAETTKANATRTLLVTRAKAGPGQRSVTLPATLRGAREAAIYARTNGYVLAWKKDIGDKVRKGEVLALIDTPEVDQDLAQAKATQDQIRARLGLAQTSLQRWEGLRQRDAVSAQELDERRAAMQQAQADLAASQANVRRLQQLHDFGRITAPFDGVVVRRNVEVGALVASGSATNTRTLYDLAQTDSLRLSVAVPQAYAGDVAVGKEVSIKLIERPNAGFKGKVSRVAGGVDTATRSVQVEVEVPNPEGKLLPGAYVEATLPLSGNKGAMLLAPTALQFRQDGPRVATVVGDRVEFKQIKVGRDLGRAVEVTAGLSPKDVVVLNPYDTLENGEKVLTKEAPPEKEPTKDAAKGGASAPQNNTKPERPSAKG